MSGWQELHRAVMNRNLNSTTWVSEQKSLLAIVKVAKAWNMDPSSALKAPISNLRAIINAAKTAIEQNDRAHLSRLFDWAATLTTADLRVKIGSHVLETLPFWKETQGADIQFHVVLTTKQFNQIKKMTKSRYAFHNTIT